MNTNNTTTRSKTDLLLDEILTHIRNRGEENAAEDVAKAANFCSHSAGKQCQDGLSPVEHGLAVVSLALRLKLDHPSLLAALLWYTLDGEWAETVVSQEELAEHFGEEAARLAELLHSLKKLDFGGLRQTTADSFRRMILTVAKDFRVILLKLAIRLEEMRVGQEFPQEKHWLHRAKETRDIYAPLANRLGIHWVKSELEDLSFRFLEPERYRFLADSIAVKRSERAEAIEKVLATLRTILADNGLINAKVNGRPKHFFSIHKKMLKKDLDVDQVYDQTAFRVIVRAEGDCYRALGLVHATWKPQVGTFKDYIAMPKPNGYKSLHTVVVGPLGRMEIQIRTQAMHDIAENGVAAHWKYKESDSVKAEGDELDQINWLRNLLDWSPKPGEDGSRDLMDALKVHLFKDRVFVFTPQGDVKELPRGATALDFAYHVHTRIGRTTFGARVNDKMVPLRTTLANNDVVEVLTRSNQKPKREWLDWVVTHRARSKIRHALREEEREEARLEGKALLERELKTLGIHFSRLQKQGDLEQAARKMRSRNLNELLIHLGYGRVSIKAVMPHLVSKEQLESYLESHTEPAKKDLSRREHALQKEERRRRSISKSGVVVDGLSDLMVHFSKCCSPLSGDPIVGYITRGRGLSIHHATCRVVKDLERARLVDAHWDREEPMSFPVRVRVLSENRMGQLGKISEVFSQHQVDVISAQVDSKRERGQSVFRISVKNLEQLDRVLADLRALRGVLQARRIR